MDHLALDILVSIRPWVPLNFWGDCKYVLPMCFNFTFVCVEFYSAHRVEVSTDTKWTCKIVLFSS